MDDAWLIDGRGSEALVNCHDNLIALGCAGVLNLKSFDESSITKANNYHAGLSSCLKIALNSENIENPIKFVWGHSESLNAVAISATKKCPPTISIYFGAIDIINHTFNSLLSSRQFLAKVGDVRLEAERPQLGHFETSFDKIIKEYGSMQPKCRIRHRLARFMASAALEFILFHELGHIVNGHISPESLRFEFGAYGGSEENLFAHTLEMDADATAVVFLFSKFFPIFNNDLRSFHVESDREACHFLRLIFGVGLRGVAKFLALLLAAFFFLFPSNIITKSNLLSHYHPHPYLRQLMAFQVLSNHISKLFPQISKKEIVAYAGSGLLETIMPLGPGNSYREDLFSFEILLKDGTLDAYINTLLKAWSDVLFAECDSRKLRVRSSLAKPQEIIGGLLT
ncbi:hypothetical protein ACFQS7_06230 [Dankookia sp. GCM10030260]|uniref:hypothetical protein n=1 Tax=Dankookia sp. GCM10030260 TaxID=3273390 RepID=UPI00360E529E